MQYRPLWSVEKPSTTRGFSSRREPKITPKDVSLTGWPSKSWPSKALSAPAYTPFLCQLCAQFDVSNAQPKPGKTQWRNSSTTHQSSATPETASPRYPELSEPL